MHLRIGLSGWHVGDFKPLGKWHVSRWHWWGSNPCMDNSLTPHSTPYPLSHHLPTYFNIYLTIYHNKVLGHMQHFSPTSNSESVRTIMTDVATYTILVALVVSSPVSVSVCVLSLVSSPMCLHPSFYQYSVINNMLQEGLRKYHMSSPECIQANS